MRINLSFLSDRMSGSFPVTSVRISYDHAINGVRMYRPGKELREDLCYVCKPDKFSGPVIKDANFILIGRDDERFHDADRIVIGQEMDSAAVLDFLQDVYEEISGWEHAISDAVAEDMGIQRMLELSSDIFGNNTLVVTSISRMVLGYVQNSGPGLMLPSRTYIAGHEYMRPPAYLRRMSENLVDDEKRSPFFKDAVIQGSSLHMLRTNLFSQHGNLIGRMTITEYDKPLKNCHAELAAHLTSQLCLALERTTELIQWKGSAGIIGLSEALKNGISDVHAANQLRAMAGWSDEDIYTIMVIDFGHTSYSAEEYIHSLRFTISSQFPLAQTLLMDRRMVVICRKLKSPVIPHDFLEWMQGYVKDLHFSCGVSEEFDNISNANLFYAHALFALAQAGEGSLLIYADCLTADVISCYKKEHYSRCGIIAPVEALAVHDRKHNINLIKTLYYYLLCDRSHRRCAEALKIHKSSLQYRLTLIRDITGIEFETLSPEQRMNLLLSLRLSM